MKTLTEKRFFHWVEDDKSVTLRNKSGSYGGGSEVLVICSIRPKSDPSVPRTTNGVCYGIDQQGGKGGANYTVDVAPTMASDSHGTPHAVAYRKQGHPQNAEQGQGWEQAKQGKLIVCVKK